MKIGILGTGMVGQNHASRLSQLGHDVVIGTRSVGKTMSRKKDITGMMFKDWMKKNPRVQIATFSEAAKHGEIVINATKGEATLDALKMAGKDNLKGKVLIDISNALDFSTTPPTLFVCNTDSLGERVQKALPKTFVVKSFNTVNAAVQANPKKLGKGDHSIFMSGNSKNAKDKVRKLIRSYGWMDIIDLGDITTARGAEAMMLMWLRLWNALGNPVLNYKIVR